MSNIETDNYLRKSCMLQYIGIFIIINTLLVAFLWLGTKTSWNGKSITIFSFIIASSLATGLVLIFNQRAIELSFGEYAKLKVATEQAETDANEIAELRKRIEAQSATIDLVAKQATDAEKLSQNVADKNTEAEKKLTKIDTALSKADESLSMLDSYSKYYATVIAAQGGNRAAYDQLGILATDNNFPFKENAQQLYQKIMDDHSQALHYTGFQINWNEGVDPNKFTIEQLKREFLNPDIRQDPYIRRALLEFIWQRNDIPKIDRLDFMVEVMKTENHLMVCEYAGRYFTEGTGQKIKPLALNHLIDWWNKNRNNFIEKPAQ